jgi:DNA-binding response OmpR family regulator
VVDQSRKYRILIVEDSAALRQLIASYLRTNGMQVDLAWSLQGARRALKIFKPELVILDLGLEDGDGYDLIADITAAGAPCIVISARERPIDRILSLELGADDYMTKPIELRELLLRLRRLARLITPNGSGNASNIVEFHNVKLDIANREVVRANGQPGNRLTAAEFRLLRLFLETPGEVIARATIAKKVLNKSWIENSRAIDVLVSKLRRKLETGGGELTLRNVRGTGYMLETPNKASQQFAPSE